jgi:hypothetical protein
MEQRPLRLGDVVDDYCPRERRITNHAIVALVDNQIRQTRCSTCEAEHVFKEARVPKRRKPEDGAALTDEAVGAPGVVGPEVVGPQVVEPEVVENDAVVAAEASDDAVDTPSTDDETVAAANDEQPGDTWLAHRRLIRATLPRVDGEPPAPRPIPEFTMHQRQARGGGRNGQWHGGQGRNGFRHGRPGSGQADGNGNGNSQGQPGQGGRPGRGGGRSGRPRGPHKRSR